MGTLIALIRINNMWVLIGGGLLLGIAMVPGISVGLELGCEIAYPVGEANVAGVMLAFYNTMSVAAVIYIYIYIYIE